MMNSTKRATTLLLLLLFVITLLLITNPGTFANAAALPQPTPPIVTILVDQLNVRFGPDTGFERVGSVKRGEQLIVENISENCSWLLVEAKNGVRGWISGSPTYVSMNVACENFYEASYAWVQSATATPTPNTPATPTATPTEQPSLGVSTDQIDLSLTSQRKQLLQEIKDQHNLYLGQMPEKYRYRSSGSFCFAPPESLTDYYEGLRKMTSRLLTHSLANSFTVHELEDIFDEVVPNLAHFIAGEQDAVLVEMTNNRGCSYGSHYPAEVSFYVVDQAGAIWNIDPAGFLRDSWYIDGRWILLVAQGVNPGNKTGPYVVLQIGKVDAKWTLVANYRFSPDPDGVRDMRFENGYQTMIATASYQYDTDPCKFSREFQEKYQHQGWHTQQTFKLVDGNYQLVDLKILDFVVYERSSQQPVDINWLDYCVQ